MLDRALIPLPLYKADLDESTLAKLGPDAIPQDGERPIPNITKGKRRPDKSSWIDWFYGPPDVKTIATNLIMRKCILSRSIHWISLLQKYGTREEIDSIPANAQQEIKRLVVEIWELNDLVDARAQNYNTLKRKFFAHKSSSSIRNWTEDLAARVQELEDMFGLDYEILKADCEQGVGEETRVCMEEAVRRHPWNEDVNAATALYHLRTRMDIAEFKLHRFPKSWRPERHVYGRDLDYQRLDVIFQASREFLQVGKGPSRFHFRLHFHRCKRRTLRNMEARLERIREQVTAPAEQLSLLRPCEEKADRFCPEGTAAVRKKSFNSLAAASAFAISYPAINALGGVAGAVIGGAKHGVLGMVGGFGVGFALTVASPADEIFCSLTAAVTGFIAGHNECACFSRACFYDEVQQTCAIAGPYKNASKNPFARALPYQGLKCVPHRKKAAFCRFEACSTTDFQPFVGQGLYGTIGPVDQGLYNCLSTSPNPTESLEIAETLPGGANNTAEARMALFRELRVVPHPDRGMPTPSWVTSTDATVAEQPDSVDNAPIACERCIAS